MSVVEQNRENADGIWVKWMEYRESGQNMEKADGIRVDWTEPWSPSGCGCKFVNQDKYVSFGHRYRICRQSPAQDISKI